MFYFCRSRLSPVGLVLGICFLNVASSTNIDDVAFSNNRSLSITNTLLTERYQTDQRLISRLLQIPEMFWLRQRLGIRAPATSIKMPHSTPETTTDQCEVDLDYAVTSAKQPWALKMLDASSKVESGILYSQLYWTGNYEECLNVSAPPSQNTTGFRGQYCFLVFSPLDALAVQSAVCVPDSCNASQVEQYFFRFVTSLEKLPFVKKLFDALNLQGIRCIAESAFWNKSSITYMFFLSLLASVVLIATLYDLYKERKSLQCSINESCNVSMPSEPDFSDVDLHSERILPLISIIAPEPKNGILLCFSAFQNGSKIMDTSVKEDQLDCLHGVRFLSMTWVILGHTYVGGIMQMSNILSFLQETDTFAFLTITQGAFAVDSFFYLSGFLLAYMFLKDGPIPMGIRKWVCFYVHRYIRLTPTYAMIIGLWASVWLYVGSGPFWQFEGNPDQINCQKNWWENLLYINNFPNVTDMCMGWSWYLANDMQFFVISPVFLFPLMKWPVVGVVITVCILLASWIATGVISYRNNLVVWASELTNLTDALTQEQQFMELIYIKPYTRIGPYLIGVLVAVGYLSFRKRKTILNKWVMLVGWACATAMTLATVYGVYHTHMGIVGSAFYNALSRSAFALGLGWLTFACLTGNGGPINWMLSWKMWKPVSRLTYGAYLLHPLMTSWYFGSLKSTFHFSHPTLVMIFFGVLFVSYVAAFIASLLIESPIISLEKLLRNRFR